MSKSKQQNSCNKAKTKNQVAIQAAGSLSERYIISQAKKSHIYASLYVVYKNLCRDNRTARNPLGPRQMTRKVDLYVCTVCTWKNHIILGPTAVSARIHAPVLTNGPIWERSW